MTFKEFCETHRINVVKCWPESTEITNGIHFYRYGLELQCGPIGKINVHRTTYGVGEGIVERWGNDRLFRAADNIRSPSDKRAWLDKAAKRYEPEAADVLQCLASDAQSVQNARSFEEWASDLGYDPDSRKAEGIYRACCDQALALQRWLGLEKYAQLIECTED